MSSTETRAFNRLKKTPTPDLEAKAGELAEKAQSDSGLTQGQSVHRRRVEQVLRGRDDARAALEELRVDQEKTTIPDNTNHDEYHASGYGDALYGINRSFMYEGPEKAAYEEGFMKKSFELGQRAGKLDADSGRDMQGDLQNSSRLPGYIHGYTERASQLSEEKGYKDAGKGLNNAEYISCDIRRAAYGRGQQRYRDEEHDDEGERILRI